MPWCLRPVGTGTCSICPPTRRPATSRPPSGPGSAARRSGNPCFTQIHPTCIPHSGEYQSKLTLMSESLRNDGRVWVPRQKADRRPAHAIPEPERDTTGSGSIPASATWRRETSPPAAAKQVCDEAGGWARPAIVSTWTSPTRSAVRRRHYPGAGTATCSRCTSGSRAEDPYRVPMRIFPAVHYTMAGSGWTTTYEHAPRPCTSLARPTSRITGPTGSAASALMQGLADGYFIVSLHPRGLPRDVETGAGRRSHPEFSGWSPTYRSG